SAGRRGLHHGANANAIAIPAFDRDAAVLARIHVQRPRRHRRLAHFAEALVIAIAPVVVAARIGVAVNLRARVLGTAAVVAVGVVIAEVPPDLAANLAVNLRVDAAARLHRDALGAAKLPLHRALGISQAALDVSMHLLGDTFGAFGGVIAAAGLPGEGLGVRGGGHPGQDGAGEEDAKGGRLHGSFDGKQRPWVGAYR